MQNGAPTDKFERLRIFLCHSLEDKTSVRVLYRRLRSEGFDVWLDDEKLLPGQDWKMEIARAVRTSHVVIVCLSKDSINKEGFVQHEISVALDVAKEKPEGTIFIVPLRLEPCKVPDRLANPQWVDYFDADGYGKLLRALHRRAADKGLAINSVSQRANKPTVALASDDSDFASDLLKIAHNAGFDLIATDLYKTESLLSASLLIFVRGEKFAGRGTSGFYKALTAFVANGGFLLATCWTSWESRFCEEFRAVLPFKHLDGHYRENQSLRVRRTGDTLAREFPEEMEIITSYEDLQYHDSIVLLKTHDGTPVFGFKSFARGKCFYLNCCQHSCEVKMESPLRQCPGLRNGMQAVLNALYAELLTRTKAIIPSLPQTLTL
jgi:hypothetical protein